jgi:hypothetical protein
LTYEECAKVICELIEQVGRGETSVEGAKHIAKSTVFELTMTQLKHLANTIGKSVLGDKTA